jgi:Big-like domain-containing protein/PKD domain-containing protein
MVTQRRRVLALASAIVGLVGLVVSCNKVPLLAPTGAKITLIPETSSVSLNSQATIVATVIENGTAPSTGSGSGGATTTTSGGGTPVHDGTHVTFTTTIGQIQPSDAVTVNGQTQVTLITGGQSGTAHITAYSGGASATVDLPVGTAAVKIVTLTATPQTLGANGGASNIVANVTDTNGTALGGVPVAFSTDHGTLTPATVQTDANGNATTVLSTTATAKVTATAGTVTSAAATVNVNSRGLSGFSASPASTTSGTPVSFSITPTSGVNLSNVHVDFGDGSAVDLGAISAATTTSHAYSTAGTYTATATPFDVTGAGAGLSTQVIIGSLQVTLTASSTSPPVGTAVTFTVNGVSTAAVDHFVWSFDDGTPSFSTSGPAISHVFTSRGLKTVAVDVFGVGGGKLGSATTQVTVQ